MKKIIAILLLTLSFGVISHTKDPVKLSKSGICHAPGSTYYEQTKNFTPYKTMDIFYE